MKNHHCRRHFLFHLFFTICIGQTRAGVATLYEVSTKLVPTLTSSISVIESGMTNVHAIGTGADGKTTYVQDNVVSLYIAKFPSPDNPAQTATTTLITTPQTIAVTFAEDKDGYHATRSLTIISPSNSPLAFQAGLDERCVFFANGTGSCVRIDIGLDTATRTSLSTTTYTGTLAPWYTASNNAGAAASGGGDQTAKPTSNAANSIRGLGWRDSALGMLGVAMGGLGVCVLSDLGILGFRLW